MANRALSPPVTMEYVSVCAGTSASVACTVTTVPTPFSAKLAVEADVNTGLLSFTPVTVTATAWLVVRVPSLAVTCTS